MKKLVGLSLFLLLAGGGPLLAQGLPNPPPRSFSYDFSQEAALADRIDPDHPDPAVLQEIFAQRRSRVLEAMPEGAMIVFSVEWVQPRRLEFQVPDSDNHDFVFLTGLEGLESLNSALLLVPAGEGGADQDWVVLFTSEDPDRIRSMTGIEDVRPFPELEESLSVAMTDYRDWRITQIRRWPLPAALSKSWGRDHKVLYLNYPRFFRLGMPEPERLALFDRFRRFSPEMDLRDSADILDSVRMLHDAWGLACLRRAVEITTEGTLEGLRAAHPGMTESEVMETVDYVYRYRGATLGFPTSVRRQPPGGRAPSPHIPEGFIQYVSRSGGEVFTEEDLLHIDTGAAFRHYSADIQRTIPIRGTLDAGQRQLYEVALDVQRTVIEMVRPGVTWWDLHNTADRMLREAGGYDQFWTYGIGHFIGMEVHDEGDYEVPLRPGMVLAIEQGVAPPDGPRVAFEDDVLVTESGFEWLSRTIPLEIADMEAMLRVESNLTSFVRKGR
ncbi:M24 family metallopeptidase [Gemmatimonadota bacterium]